MTGFSTAISALATLGARPVGWYALYRLQLAVGWARRATPSYRWVDRPLASWLEGGVPSEPSDYLAYRRARQGANPFFFDPARGPAGLEELRSRASAPAVVQEAQALLDGKFVLFGRPGVGMGFPPDWSRFAPLEGLSSGDVSVDVSRHWTEYDHQTLEQDVKLLWEPSRFGWIYPLARAYRLTEEDRFADAFWELLVSWREQNQPNTGPHWLSAQEVAIRLLALTFGLYAFWPWVEARPERLGLLAQTVAVHAARIPSTLAYARAQDNNHLLLEAAGVYTAGLLFPEFKRAAGWRRLGRRTFAAALGRQVFTDGGYIQHSANYHRVALQVGTWVHRLAQLHGDSLAERIRPALTRAAGCLAALVEPDSGRAPNFGPNDGAYLLPLADCAFEDMRPAVQAAWLAACGEPAFPRGAWDEAAMWLGIRNAAGKSQAGVSPTRRKAFPAAGFYLMDDRGWRGILRCATFAARPGHSDQLHVDLWWGGTNLAMDAGTYLYNGKEPWENRLAAADVHNSVVVDGRDPMRRAGRFLWLSWAQGTVIDHWLEDTGSLEAIAGVHDGYRSIGVVHQRTLVRAGQQAWIVVDDLLGTGVHRAHCSWLLPDGAWSWQAPSFELTLGGTTFCLRFEAPTARISLYRAGDLLLGSGEEIASPVWGWHSRLYAQKQPALYLVASKQGPLPIRLVSLWRLGDGKGAEPELAWREPSVGVPSLASVRLGSARLDL